MPNQLAVLKVYPRGIQDLSEPNFGYETQVPPLEFPDGMPEDDDQLSPDAVAERLD